MQIKKIRIHKNEKMAYLAAIIGLGVFAAQMLKAHTVVSLLFAASFVCIAANYLRIIAARKRIRIDDIFLFLLAVLSLVLSDLPFNFDYYKPAIIAVCCTLCIDQSAQIYVSVKAGRRIMRLLVLVCVFTNGLYYGGMRQGTGLVGLNFSNPNEAAMWLVFLIVLLCDSAAIQSNLCMKLVSLICGASLLPILHGTQSRNCLIAVFFYFAGKLILQIFKVKKMPDWLVLLVTMAPVFVYVVYMYIFIPHYDQLAGWFRFLVSEGKPLTSRAAIWSDLEMQEIKHILFGNYAVYRVKNLHNSMISLYCGFGAVYVFLAYWKAYKVLKRMPNAGMQIALSTVWLTGCFEASIFVGVAGLYMLILLLPIFHQKENTGF